MSQVVERAVKKGIFIGASEVEAHYSITKGIRVMVESNEIKDTSWAVNRSLHVAVFVGKKVGFSHTTNVSDEGIVEAVDRAYRLASSSRENPFWKNLPSPKSFPNVRGTFDDKIASLSPEDVVGFAGKMLGQAREDPRVSVMGGGVNSGQSEVYVANSAGVTGYDRGTGISMDIVALAKDGEEIGSFAQSWEASRRLDLDPAEIGREGAVKALESLGAKKVESFTGSVILDYDAALDFISALSEALNGDMVWRGSSPLRDKVGQEIAKESFSLVDDGTLESGVSSSLFDYEGVPRMKTVLIDRGILKGFLHNTYTAGILKVESTGNASGFLSVAPSNLLVKAGDLSTEEMIGNMKRGLMVKRFSGYIRPEDGVVSGSVKQAFLIENGKVKHPVKECMISGNLYELLKKIIGISKIAKRRGPFIVPQIMFESMSIVG